VEWIHPLNPATVTHRVCGKGHTLPTFWTICAPCEPIHEAGHEAALVEIMKGAEHWIWASDDDMGERIRKPLHTFRRSDLGRRRF
jgi:hypothetical protein